MTTPLLTAAVPKSMLTWLDWTVIAAYFALVAFVAWRASIHPVDVVTTLIVGAMILGAYLYFSFWV